MKVFEVVCACGIPSAIFGLIVWWLKKYIDKKEEERRSRDERLENVMMSIVNGVDASLHVSEATAKAVARIPDAHCNGDMHEALEYATEKRHEMNNYLVNQGIQRIF